MSEIHVTPVELRTDNTWRKDFESIVQSMSPHYRLNPGIKGRMTECLRQDSTGLFFSHNTDRLHGDYAHGFACLFSKIKRTNAHYSVLYFGNRFDDGLSVREDLKKYLPSEARPARFQCWHSYLAGFEEIVKKCTLFAETELLPRHLQILHRGKDKLGEVFETAASVVQRLSSVSPKEDSAAGNGALLDDFVRHFPVIG